MLPGLSSSCAERGLLSSRCTGLSLRWLLVAENRLNGCSTRAWLFHGMWDLPGSGLKLLSPAFTGGFFTTEPPNKSRHAGSLVTAFELLVAA